MDTSRTTPVLLLLALSAVACAAAPQGRPERVPAANAAPATLPTEGVTVSTNPDAALLGAWNGDHISLELTSQGGTVEFDCAHGAIDRAIVPDPAGNFDVPGRYVEEHGGPVREGEATTGFAVRYSGRVTNGRMKLTITRSDINEPLGSFTLERGREPSLVKCL